MPSTADVPERSQPPASAAAFGAEVPAYSGDGERRAGGRSIRVICINDSDGEKACINDRKDVLPRHPSGSLSKSPTRAIIPAAHPSHDSSPSSEPCIRVAIPAGSGEERDRWVRHLESALARFRAASVLQARRGH